MNEFRRKNSHHGPSVEKLKFDKSSGSYINAKDENWASKIAKSEINIIKRYFWNLYNNKSMYYLNKKQNQGMVIWVNERVWILWNQFAENIQNIYLWDVSLQSNQKNKNRIKT